MSPLGTNAKCRDVRYSVANEGKARSLSPFRALQNPAVIATLESIVGIVLEP